MSEEDTKTVVAEFPADLARKAKADAALCGMTFKEWMQEAARTRLREREAHQSAE